MKREVKERKLQALKVLHSKSHDLAKSVSFAMHFTQYGYELYSATKVSLHK